MYLILLHHVFPSVSIKTNERKDYFEITICFLQDVSKIRNIVSLEIIFSLIKIRNIFCAIHDLGQRHVELSH